MTGKLLNMQDTIRVDIPFPKEPAEVPKFVRTMRLLRGLTLREFAEHTGLSVASLSGMETGERTVTLESAQKMLEPFGLGMRAKFELFELPKPESERCSGG